MKALWLLCCLVGPALQGQDSRPASAPTTKDAGRLVKQLEIDGQVEAATQALIHLGKQALPPLLVALDDPRLKVRVRAVRVLGALGPDARLALPVLEKFAKDETSKLAFPAFEALARIRYSGRTLIADYSDNRITEVDENGKRTFAINDIFGVWDVERLPNGNLLLTEFSVNRVREITPEGKTVWTFDSLKNPYDADRLPNGNTLIADTFGRRVIEVNKDGSVVWRYNDKIQPYDADRLSNGNTLLTIRMLNLVREVDPNGKTVMEILDLRAPSDADRLPNGHTLVAENGMVREFDKSGKEVWRFKTTWAVEVNRY